jgi:hypothetical protein
MMRKKRAILWLAAVGALAACSNQVSITPEPTGTTNKSTSDQPTTSKTVGSSSSSSGTATTSSSSSGGTGGATTSSGGPPAARAVTADGDMAQAQAISLPYDASSGPAVKIVAGPFFVTDAYSTMSFAHFTTVVGDDCTVPVDQHTRVLAIASGPSSYVLPAQIHGIRMPILPGQSLCILPENQGGPNNVTVLGFRPY